MIKTEMNMINIKMADLEMMIDTEMLINIIKTEMKIDIMREKMKDTDIKKGI
jgi:hypothetical protein